MVHLPPQSTSFVFRVPPLEITNTSHQVLRTKQHRALKSFSATQRDHISFHRREVSSAEPQFSFGYLDHTKSLADRKPEQPIPEGTMDYDFRNRAPPPYRQNTTGATSSPSTHPMYGNPSLYPKVGQSIGNPIAGAARNPPLHHAPSPPSSGIGIRVALKPEYRITPPPPLLPQVGDIPRSNFHYDFDFERRILAEAEKENRNWSRLGLENLPSRRTESTPLGSSGDPVVNKYLASGLSREAVPLAVANYGDNPEKIREFVNGFTLLREMGFSSNNVAEALLMYDNDTDKALAHFLNNSS